MPIKHKYLLIISLMMVLCLPVFAEFVQPEQAIRVAANWLNHWQREQISSPNFSEIHSYNLGTVSRIESGRKYNEALNPLPELYLVYFGDGGYAVVPGDDNLRPVLVYSHTGLADKSDFPPAFKMWLSFYAGDVRYARDSQVFIAENRALWQDVERGTMNYFPREREVGELLSTNWNQGWPYNELCPLDSEGPGGRVYAGCVATAMAQVMKYWNKPVTGQGSNSYYAVGYGYQSANFGATTYLWDEMPNSISSSNLPIATLLYHCAVSVNMSFAPDGSGSNGMLARAAMQNNFRYPNASYVQKQNYNTTNWENLLKAQLD
ncbi:MAG: C10 family peptidase, partial [Candidatus Cloacimonetes bacterium]|nr:C10 family peptidase [Candidatus Cloacimonadota bacterium]